MPLTHFQQQAVAARGNVVVVAGAGTGKTRTLVERCLDCLLRERPPVSMDEILMVTFTDAAAAEMRQRIRSRLEEEQQARPDESRWQEQLALFDTAHIGTLHSFCFELVRQHFYELELDPQLTVLPAEEASLLATETLATVLARHYAGTAETASAVQALIQAQGGGRDHRVRALVLRLHHYTQTLPDPDGWYEKQAALLKGESPEVWIGWLTEAIRAWPGQWDSFLANRASANSLARQCLALTQQLPTADRAKANAILRKILDTYDDCPHGQKQKLIDPLKDFYAEAQFLASVAGPSPEGDPLAQDWGWVRDHTRTLLGLAREFHTAFTEAKRELGLLDFHDLEQHALRLLRDPKTGQPTAIARQWQQKLRFIFVDEYQDINAAQDKIIEALSRDGAAANRCLVGDVKQSIYRFRLANPRIFQGYVANWRGQGGHSIPLTDNFRSRADILHFINSLFRTIMTPELGGVAYDQEAELKFGATEHAQAAARDGLPSVELHLRPKAGAYAESDFDEEDEVLAKLAELGEAEKEARLVGLRLQELKSQGRLIWDETAKAHRPVGWGDMAVLVRAPANKAESYAKEFSRLNVPLQVVRGGFYKSAEISDLVNLLRLLDNPLQDVPAVAVLRSPLVGLTLDELAAIRLAQRHGPFFTALLRWNEPHASIQGVADHPTRIFLARFARWRQLARQASLSRCLQAVLSETHYDAWLLTQPRGAERHANVQRFLALAQQFDQLQRQGLFRFLSYLDGQRTAESRPDAGPIAPDDSVRLMSIHRSKGLEFPVVVVADLAKKFNESDLRDEIIFDEQYGLCPQIKAPATGRRYPSLPYWLARRRQRREMLGEELRLLYVALTRARDVLILTASVPPKRLEGVWRGVEADHEEPASARSYADWLALWCSRNGGLTAAPATDGSGTQSGKDPVSRGQNKFWQWRIHQDTGLIADVSESDQNGPEAAQVAVTEPVLTGLQRRLAWRYAYPTATRQPAKMTVSALRRQAVERDHEAEEITALGPSIAFRKRPPRFPSTSAASAERVGKVHHRFLQLVGLSVPPTLEAMKAEARRLATETSLGPDEVELLDFSGLAAFWQSDLGSDIRAQAQYVHRELAFTARFSAAELAGLTGDPAPSDLADDFVVVQGIADVAIIRPEEIRLIDFKTDRVTPDELEATAGNYEPQLRLYAHALSKIYSRPVSASWLYFLAAREARRVEGPAWAGVQK